MTKGLAQEIIEQIKEESVMKIGTINRKTVLSRVDRMNVTGDCYQKCSPLESIEPYIVAYCRQASKIGMPFTRDEIIELTESVIQGTQHRTNLINLKQKIGVYHNQPTTESVVGRKWYEGFMRRHSTLLK